MTQRKGSKKQQERKLGWCTLCGKRVEVLMWHDQRRCPHCFAYLTARDPYPPEAESGFGAEPHGNVHAVPSGESAGR